MNEKWKEYTFGEVVHFPPNVKVKKGESYPFIPMENITSGYKYVKPLFEKQITGGGAKFEEGDTLFARITPCLENDKIAQAKDLNGKPGFGSTEYFIFRGKEGISNSDFVYYFSKTKWFTQNAINSMVGASGRQRADAGFVKNLKVNFPTLLTQQKIGSILSAYDDLIENNTKRIKLLEEQAQLLYEEWFVRMKFPDYENVLIDEESGLPEGWTHTNLEKVAEINAKSIPSSFDEDIKYIDISSVSTKCIDYTTEYSVEEAPSRAKRIVTHGDIIWSCVRPNRKSYAVIWKPEENTIASTGFSVISPTEVPTSFLYQVLGTEQFVGYLNNRATGAAYPAVKSIDFKEYDISLPPKSLITKFDEHTKSHIDMIWNLKQQNEKLKEARDILLPRLMMGIIEV